MDGPVCAHMHQVRSFYAQCHEVASHVLTCVLLFLINYAAPFKRLLTELF